MKIKAFTVEGPLPTEIPALKEIEKAFPSEWMGFANVIVRHPTQARYEREIDLIVVTHDRVLMVDLKHWMGRLELVDGYWHQDGVRREKSPVEKMKENVHLLMKVFDVESFRLGRPWVEGLVVLTHPHCDTSLLGSDARVVLRLGEFLRMGEPNRYKALFKRDTNHTGDPLTSAKNKNVVLKFFSPGRIFEPRKTKFASYEAVDPQPEFVSTLYAEYLARDVEIKTNTALLKVWDFTEDNELRHGPERKELLDRERAVIGYLVDRDPDLALVALRPRERDPELGPRHWELFDRDRHLQRLSSFRVKERDLGLDGRGELAKVLSGHVAGLHRAGIAHRDLGDHSVWVDPARSRVSLSSFAAARYPERRSVGLLRVKLLGAGLTLPEDSGVIEEGSAFQQDVFLLGLAVWSIFGGSPIPTETGVPNWATLSDAAKASVPSRLRDWLGRCLDWDPASRFNDGIESHDALLKALVPDRMDEAGAVDLASYEANIDPTIDYRPEEMIERSRCRIYTTRVGEEKLLVKNWPERLLGDRGKNAARLIEFFARADRLRGSGSGRLPHVRLACLSHDGLFLLQDYLPGDPLETCDVSKWTLEQFRTFGLELIDAIAEAHDLGIPHGDLSPKNVLVAQTQGPVPRVVDFLDFSTEAAGERTTLAYVPTEGGADPYIRDRYAVATMLTETTAKIEAAQATELASLSRAVKACADSEAPWATLKPLIDALANGGSAREANKVNLVIGFPRCQAPGPMLADDGKFHVVAIPDLDEINIVGFDCQLVIKIDRGTSKIRSVRASEAKTQTLVWASRQKAMSIEGSVVLFEAAKVSAEGFDQFLALDGLTLWPDKPGTQEVLVSPRPEKSGPPRPYFPIAKFWEEQIKAEENLRPSITVADEVTAGPDRDIVIVPHDGDSALEDIDDGDLVFFNGARIGMVAAEYTAAGSLAFRSSGGRRQLKPGDELTLQPRQDAESLRRRAQAIRRILQGKTPIKNLVSYFDPSSGSETYEIAQPVQRDDLALYGFNPDQIEAFDKLWSNGPVGLLQGPPGTGKTKFIAGFGHYALTKGGCRNLLLVSQSHEAVNNAAERIQELMQDTSGGLDLLRVSNDPDKISDALRRSHVGSIQDFYVARFEAEAKDRLCMIARRLGLDSAFAGEFFEAHEGPVETARQLERLRGLKVKGEDAASLRQRVQSLEDALSAQLMKYGIDVGVAADYGEVAAAVTMNVRERHGVRNMEAVRRLRAVWETGREWTKTLRTKSRTLEEFLAGSRRLVCGTCVGIGNPRLRITDKTFDLVIVDEAARATSSELAVAMQSAHRVLLVGDHRQLPPNVDLNVVKRLAVTTGITDEPELLRSDFERVFESRYGQLAGTALKRQYRMAPKIGKLVSDVFYPDVGLITEREPPGVHYDGLPFPFDDEFAWMDCNSAFGETKRGFSFVNQAEAQAIVRLLETLAAQTDFLKSARADLKEGEPLIGVICMYAQQRDLVKDMLATSSVGRDLRSIVKIETVDSYQGKENRIIIVSLVRSNNRGSIGYLDKENRINVALSRAMDRLIVVGSSTQFRTSAGKLPEVLARMEAAGRVSSKRPNRPEAA